jgi:uncharacterized membrane protein YccC
VRQIIEEAMPEGEQIDMMRRASSEIKQLRLSNAELAPKADAYDTIRQILDMVPQRSRGMAEDIAWRLDRRIDQIEEGLKKASAPAADQASGD